jgi:hypothetical protein
MSDDVDELFLIAVAVQSHGLEHTLSENANGQVLIKVSERADEEDLVDDRTSLELCLKNERTEGSRLERISVTF